MQWPGCPHRTTRSSPAREFSGETTLRQVNLKKKQKLVDLHWLETTSLMMFSSSDNDFASRILEGDTLHCVGTLSGMGFTVVHRFPIKQTSFILFSLTFFQLDISWANFSHSFHLSRGTLFFRNFAKAFLRLYEDNSVYWNFQDAYSILQYCLITAARFSKTLQEDYKDKSVYWLSWSLYRLCGDFKRTLLWSFVSTMSPKTASLSEIYR